MGSPLLLPLLLVGRTVAQQGAPTNHIHHSPPCARGGGWHDIAGALSLGERDHHIWQGCGSGWGYSWSPDLVRWQFVNIAPHAVPETYEGMASDSTPCSGFATLDDAGRLCAGFRQCSSTHGTTGLNPAAAVWDVPLELRCANTSSRIGNERRAGPPILEWSAPQYLYNPYYHTNPLPYDPPRPWREGLPNGSGYVWRSLLSAHGCNDTQHGGNSPFNCTIDTCCSGPTCACTRGGRLDMWEAPRLTGPWSLEPEPFFAENTTAGPQPAACGQGFIHNEFVTTGVFGVGDSVVITSNYCGNLYSTYWLGNITGKRFKPYPNATGSGPLGGVIDYGPICLVRTLGAGDPRNQVTAPGRRVMIGQLRPFPFDDPPSAPNRLSSQSLARDITLSTFSDNQLSSVAGTSVPVLLQQFVPELKSLRQQRRVLSASNSRISPATLQVRENHAHSSVATRGLILIEGQQFELVASFGWHGSVPPQEHFGLCLNGPPTRCAALVISCNGQECQVQARSHYNSQDIRSNRRMLELGWTGQQGPQKVAWGGAATNVTGPMPAIALQNRRLNVHAISDGNILEVIWENRTSTTLYYSPSAGNSTLRVFANGVEANVEAWRLDPVKHRLDRLIVDGG